VRRQARRFDITLPIAQVLSDPQKQWDKLTRGRLRVATNRKLSVDWDEYSQDRYLFVHSTIVSSVKVASNGYYIDPPCDELINNNGNGWATPVLMSTFRTFIGKNNYLEHVQIPALSKGKILDAISRPVVFAGRNGDKADVVYIDILVAVDRKHTDVIERIENGELNAMSMGCLAHWVTCSKCGKQIDDNMRNCKHLDNEMMTYFVDDKGVRRIVAELCGRMVKNKKTGKLEADPKSVEFIEASWVEKPAFKGAVLNHFVSDVDKRIAKVLQFDQLQDAVDDLFKLRVADRSGMMIIRLAREELLLRRERNIVDRLAQGFLN